MARIPKCELLGHRERRLYISYSTCGSTGNPWAGGDSRNYDDIKFDSAGLHIDELATHPGFSI